MTTTARISFGLFILAHTIGGLVETASPPNHAQESPQPPQPRGDTPTFRAKTTLIEFTIVAVDGRGRPVVNLTRDDIAIAEDNQPRDVAFFRFDGAGLGEGGTESAAATGPREALPPGIFTNRPEYMPGPPRNLTAIALDTINTTPGNQASVNAQMLRYLRTLPPESRLGVYRLGPQTTILHDISEDLASLRERITKNDQQLEAQPFARGDLGALAQGASSDERRQATQEAAIVEARMLAFRNEGLRDRRLALTLGGLEALGHHLAAVPGRKNLVWITEGMPITGSAAGFITDYAPFIRATAERLASQNITLYAVDAKGIDTLDMLTSDLGPKASKGQRPPPARAVLQRTADENRSFAAMEVLTEVTGGRLVKATNDPTDGVTRAADDLRGSYSIGFYAVREPDDAWHTLQVKVTRPGVTLRHRQGYLATSVDRVAASAEWPADRWRDVAQRALGSATVRFDARCELTSDTLSLALQIAGADLSFHQTGNRLRADVDIALAELTPTGLARVGHEQAEVTIPDDPANPPSSSVVRLMKQWPVKSGMQRIRLIVRDRRTGRFGTLDIPVAQIPRGSPQRR
jgi:VWFA-related protein